VLGESQHPACGDVAAAQNTRDTEVCSSKDGTAIRSETYRRNSAVCPLVGRRCLLIRVPVISSPRPIGDNQDLSLRKSYPRISLIQSSQGGHGGSGVNPSDCSGREWLETETKRIKEMLPISSRHFHSLAQHSPQYSKNVKNNDGGTEN
jgi:hypothetical protein